MASVTTSRLWVMYSTISLSPARFTSLNLRSLSGSDTKSKRTQHWRSFWINSSSRSWVGESRGGPRSQALLPSASPPPLLVLQGFRHPIPLPGTLSPVELPSHLLKPHPREIPQTSICRCPVPPRPGAPAPLTFPRYLSGQEASAAPGSC